MPATAAMMVPLLSVLRIDDGIWKSVVEPVFSTEKSVEVAPVLEVLPIAKRRFETRLVVEAAWTERSAVGLVVPIPTLPFEM